MTSTTDIGELHDAYFAFKAADDAFSAALTAAFGKDACNRRYDATCRGWTQDCHGTYAEFQRTGDVWRSLDRKFRNAK
jgi:hypothetical protein